MLPQHDRYKPYYWNVEIAYAYIAGYNMKDKWSNTTACYDLISNTTYLERPAYLKFLNESVRLSFDKWQARGNFWANQSYHFWVCSNSMQTFSEYWNARFTPYRENSSGWNPFAIFMLSFATNVPG